MTTERQLAANRQNAQRSTGPRTAQGKASAIRNNTRHGLRATTPVIPRLESLEAWEQHRAATIAGLAPATALEEALAERVALILWRLDRVARYERDVTSQSRDRTIADLAAGADDDDDADANAEDTDRDLVAVRRRYNEARRRARVLASLDDRLADAHLTGKDAASALDAIGEQIPGFNVDAFYAPEIVPNRLEFDAVPDWTVDRLLRFVAAIAADNNRDPDDLRADALAEARRQHRAERIAYRRLTRQLRDLRRQRILPQPPNLDQVVRYETHLMRQLSRTLGHLKQLQHTRAQPPLPLGEGRGEGSSPAPCDYHHPVDFYDSHVDASSPPAPVLADLDPVQTLPLTVPQHSEPSTQDPESDHSNPIEAPALPGQPPSEAGAAPVCATPAPAGAPLDPDCAHPDHDDATSGSPSPSQGGGG
jgi:hypothetical protein